MSGPFRRQFHSKKTEKRENFNCTFKIKSLYNFIS